MFDSRGNLLTEANPLSGITRLTYDGVRNLPTETDALGTFTTSTYDADGNRITESTPRSLSGGGNQILQTTMSYDGLGPGVAATQPDGSKTSTV